MTGNVRQAPGVVRSNAGPQQGLFFMRWIASIVTAVALVAFATPAMAQTDKELGPGSSAPGFDIEEWIVGDEVTFQPDQIYVVCFWEPSERWSEAAIGYLNSIQKNILNSWTPITTVVISRAEPDVLRSYARRMVRSEDFALHVAADRRGETWRKWMGAAKRETVPTVFIVDRAGKIQDIGNPVSSEENFREFVDLLGMIMEGRYDAVLYRQTARLRSRIRTTRRMKNWRLTNQHMDKLIETDPRVFALTHIDRFEMLLVDQDKKEEAYAYAQKLMAENADDAGLLARLAEKIATDPDIPDDKKDLDVALALAKAASLVTDSQSPTRYATIATVHFERGEIDQAVSMQRQAYRVALPALKERLKADLDRYVVAQRQQRRQRVP